MLMLLRVTLLLAVSVAFAWVVMRPGFDSLSALLTSMGSLVAVLVARSETSRLEMSVPGRTSEAERGAVHRTTRESFTPSATGPTGAERVAPAAGGDEDFEMWLPFVWFPGAFCIAGVWAVWHVWHAMSDLGYPLVTGVVIAVLAIPTIFAAVVTCTLVVVGIRSALA